MLRLHPPLTTNLDRWIESQRGPLSRPEAIRRLLEQALSRAATKRPPNKETAHKASKLAAREIEPLGDKSIPVEEQARRKRALIRGPKEFREIRDDLPKSKT